MNDATHVAAPPAVGPDTPQVAQPPIAGEITALTVPHGAILVLRTDDADGGLWVGDFRDQVAALVGHDQFLIVVLTPGASLEALPDDERARLRVMLNAWS